jgi:hypothetical protein
MKKILLISFFVCGLIMLHAQTESMVSKNGHIIHPQTGDYALGMNALPVINFALNAINIMDGSGQQAQHPGYVDGFNQILCGKYFKDDHKAYRLKFGINTARITTKIFGDDPLTSVNPENMLLVTEKSMGRDFFLAIGPEYRRGHNRLVGFYGGELLIGLSNYKEVYEYGIDYDQRAASANYMSFGSSRILKDNDGTLLSFGLRTFVGVEYFFAPKISIGAEFGWGMGLTTNPRYTIENEHWGIEAGSNATNPYNYVTETLGNNSGSSFQFAVDNGADISSSNSWKTPGIGGSAAVMIHFHF